jgi:hypothetical protein
LLILRMVYILHVELMIPYSCGIQQSTVAWPSYKATVDMSAHFASLQMVSCWYLEVATVASDCGVSKTKLVSWYSRITTAMVSTLSHLVQMAACLPLGAETKVAYGIPTRNEIETNTWIGRKCFDFGITRQRITK